MVDVEKLCRKRNLFISYIDKAKKENEEILQCDELNNNDIMELKVREKIIEEKFRVVIELYDNIIDHLDDEAQTTAEIEKCYDLEVDINKHLRRVKMAVEKFSSKPKSENKNAEYKQNIRLPKMEIKKFSGDPTEWQAFHDSFTCAVHENKYLSNVEKMNYLINLLQGEAASTLKGLQLSNANYEISLQMLKDRFGDNQVLISSFMNKLLGLEPISDLGAVNELRKLYDEIETQVRSLNSLGLDEKNYGAMLVPVVMSKLPQQVKLIITRQFGKTSWDIKLILNALKIELEAREKVSLTDKFESTTSSLHEEELCTGMTLNTSISPRDKFVCVYCKKNLLIKRDFD